MSTARSRPPALKPGLHIHRSSRTEQLALVLLDALERQPPLSVLAPQRIVVAHAALGRWLLQAIALYGERHGAGRGIAANLLFELPGGWLQRILAQLLGEPPAAAAGYTREALRWVLFDELPALAATDVAHYLAVGHGDPQLRRFQLADHLAGLYTQYLVYRRDWLLAAERGESAHWQATLWQRAVARVGPGHRAQRMDQVLRGQGSGAALLVDQPLHLFGLNHLAPDLIALLERLSRRLPVHLYVADPAPQVYWHDQPTDRARARGADAAERGHPLLAALGGLGQQFLRQLDTLNARDDALDEPQPQDWPLLVRVQEGIRLALPSLVGPPLRDADQLLQARSDASLRIHSCHTRLRELEVLRDALLELLVAHPQIHPRDIVVMAPDIRAYAHLVPAVFGAPGRDMQGQPRPLPWQLADRPLASVHPLLDEFLDLLDVPLGRITHSDLLALLEQPAIRRALQLDESGADTLRHWLQRSRVAWGLDAPMKAQVGAAPEHLHSFAHALDQLYLGMLSAGDEALAGFAGIAPLAGVAELEAPVLGALQTLLDLLAEARVRMSGSATLADWTQWLDPWMRRLLKADPADMAEVQALDTLAGVIATPALQAAGSTAVLPWPVLREALSQQLQQQPQRQPFGRGGITFCGMVPARVIPFEIVAVLGLDDGVFPRPSGEVGLSLITQLPRPGDRDVRAEDRYLFLETLLSARTALHLSFCGEDPHSDAQRNPAAPLAELIEHLLLETGSAEPGVAPWFVRHALQPFAARYFDPQQGDPRLFSYSGQFALDTAAPRSARAPFAALAAPAPRKVPAARSLARLLAFLRQPAARLLTDHHQLSLDALAAAAAPDDEPLLAQFAPLDQVERKLFERARRAGQRELPEDAPAWLARSGWMASGLAGALAWRHSRERVNAALALLVDDHPDWLAAPAIRRALQVPLESAGPALTGSAQVLRTGAGEVLLDTRIGRTAGLPHLLPLFAQYAALRADSPGRPLAVALLHGERQPAWHPQVLRWPALDEAQLQGRLQRLVDWHEDAIEANPALLFPRTAAAYAAATDHRQGWTAAHKAWNGHFKQVGERDYQPPYAALLAREQPLLDGHSAVSMHFAQGAEALAALLDLRP